MVQSDDEIPLIKVASSDTFISTRAITKREWERTRSALRDGREVPVWVSFLGEGQRRLVSGDLHGSVLSFAIATETLFRHLLSLKLESLRPELVEGVQRGLPAMRLFDQATKLRLIGRSWNPVLQGRKTTVRRLFEDRNRIMHGGGTAHLKRDECEKYRKAVREIVLFGDASLERRRR